MISLLLAATQPGPDLDAIADRAAQAAVGKFEDVKPEQIGITLLKLSDSGGWTSGGYRQDWEVYPASVIKAFYMAYAAEQISEGELRLSEEDHRAAKTMIVDSSNDATVYFFDLITGTSGGPELDEKGLADYMEERRVVNRWLSARGYEGINASQPTWNEGPFGRKRQAYGLNFEHRNMASSAACARLFGEIAQGRIGGASEKRWMFSLLKRDFTEEGKRHHSHVGAMLPESIKVYSKSGMAYQVRHDVAYVDAGPGGRWVMAILTDGHIGNAELLPFMADAMWKELGVIGA